MKNGLVDIPEFLASVMLVFDVAKFRRLSDTKFKLHGSGGCVPVPSEVAYAQVITPVIERAIGELSSWTSEPEAQPVQSKESVNLLLTRSETDDQPAFRIGIEYAASLPPKDIRKYAARQYSRQFQLDQFVVVHLTPFLGSKSQPEFFISNTDKRGKLCQIPIYHVVHNDDFTKVTLSYKLAPKDRSPVEVRIR